MQSSYRLPSFSLLITLLSAIALISGCATRSPFSASNTSHRSGLPKQSTRQGDYVTVDSSAYDAKTQTVTLRVHKVKGNGRLRGKNAVMEQVIDISTLYGVANYAVFKYPTKPIQAVEMIYPHQIIRTMRLPSRLTSPDTSTTGNVATLAKAGSAGLSGSVLPAGASKSGHVPIPPPGSKIDHSIHWRVKLTAPVWMKENAVINEARSKLGTPYIWGHNEDRGQYGFDCSNFTAYVYHHALGYKFSGASRRQAKSVGVRVPISDMRRGDLIIFEHGKHVGIYAGKHRMIQEGGGLGKVGFLSLGPKSYWGKHITSVKRMF